MFFPLPEGQKIITFRDSLPRGRSDHLGTDFESIFQLFLYKKWPQKLIFPPPEGQISITFRHGLARTPSDSPGIDFRLILESFWEAFLIKQ